MPRLSEALAVLLDTNASPQGYKVRIQPPDTERPWCMSLPSVASPARCKGQPSRLKNPCQTQRTPVKVTKLKSSHWIQIGSGARRYLGRYQPCQMQRSAIKAAKQNPATSSDCLHMDCQSCCTQG